MKTTPATTQSLANPDYEALRREILRASQRLSCHQALDLADLLHTVIRMRRRRHRLLDVETVIAEEADNRRKAPWTPRPSGSHIGPDVSDDPPAEPRSWMPSHAS